MYLTSNHEYCKQVPIRVFWPRAAENACHLPSHPVDDYPSGKSRPQQTVFFFFSLAVTDPIALCVFGVFQDFPNAIVSGFDQTLHFAFEVFSVCPPSAPCTSMSLDLELAKILDEFSVPEAFRTKLVDSACLKVWQFAEYVDDVKDWTGILSSLEPPIVDRMHIASVRRVYKAACARDAALQRPRPSRRGYGRAN